MLTLDWMKLLLSSLLSVLCIAALSQNPRSDTATVYLLVNKAISAFDKGDTKAMCQIPMVVADRYLYGKDSASVYKIPCGVHLATWEQKQIRVKKMKVMECKSTILIGQLLVSLPSFNNEMNRAIVYINQSQGESGYGGVILFKKKGTKWRRVKVVRVWVT
jgi:hypothetical protein